MTTKPGLPPIQSLQVGPTVAPVIYSQPLVDLKVMGTFEEFTGEVALNPTLREDQEPTVIFHEALHAISFQYGLGLSESKVRILEMTVASLFRDNPKFTKLYLKYLKD